MAEVTEAEDSGWLAIEGFLSAGDVAEVLAVCSELLDADASERSPRDKPVAGTRHLFELDERSEVVRAVVERPELTQAVSGFIGDSWDRFETSYRCPQPSFGGQRLHADDVPKLHDGPDAVATAIIALTEFTAKNGATRLIPGSHRRIDLQRHSGSLESHPDEIMLTGSAGTAFVFSGHVLHSGTANQSDHERPALQVVWRTAVTG